MIRMQKLILAFMLSCMARTVTNAQGFIDQVPSNATLVIKYSGENFSKAVPLQKLDHYGFIKDDFFKTLAMQVVKYVKKSKCCGGEVEFRSSQSVKSMDV